MHLVAYCLYIVCIMYYYSSVSDHLGPSALNKLIHSIH